MESFSSGKGSAGNIAMYLKRWVYFWESRKLKSSGSWKFQGVKNKKKNVLKPRKATKNEVFLKKTPFLELKLKHTDSRKHYVEFK